MGDEEGKNPGKDDAPWSQHLRMTLADAREERNAALAMQHLLNKRITQRVQQQFPSASRRGPDKRERHPVLRPRGVLDLAEKSWQQPRLGMGSRGVADADLAPK